MPYFISAIKKDKSTTEPVGEVHHLVKIVEREDGLSGRQLSPEGGDAMPIESEAEALTIAGELAMNCWVTIEYE